MRFGSYKQYFWDLLTLYKLDIAYEKEYRWRARPGLALNS